MAVDKVLIAGAYNAAAARWKGRHATSKMWGGVASKISDIYANARDEQAKWANKILDDPKSELSPNEKKVLRNEFGEMEWDPFMSITKKEEIKDLQLTQAKQMDQWQLLKTDISTAFDANKFSDSMQYNGDLDAMLKLISEDEWDGGTPLVINDCKDCKEKGQLGLYWPDAEQVAKYNEFVGPDGKWYTDTIEQDMLNTQATIDELNSQIENATAIHDATHLQILGVDLENAEQHLESLDTQLKEIEDAKEDFVTEKWTSIEDVRAKLKTKDANLSETIQKEAQGWANLAKSFPSDTDVDYSKMYPQIRKNVTAIINSAAENGNLGSLIHDKLIGREFSFYEDTVNEIMGTTYLETLSSGIPDDPNTPDVDESAVTMENITDDQIEDYVDKFGLDVLGIDPQDGFDENERKLFSDFLKQETVAYAKRKEKVDKFLGYRDENGVYHGENEKIWNTV